MQLTNLLSSVAIATSFIAAVLAQSPSPDGSCGGTNAFTCTPQFGDCCSSSGFCGSTTAHCGGGCQAAFGTCRGNETPNGTCGGTSGFTCHGAFGNCCSDHGFCGSTTAYCGVGCQTAFSATGSCATGTLPSVNGVCGGTSGFTCSDGPFDGMCCSKFGFCGTTVSHCSLFAGCQTGFGKGCVAP